MCCLKQLGFNLTERGLVVFEFIKLKLQAGFTDFFFWVSKFFIQMLLNEKYDV